MSELLNTLLTIIAVLWLFFTLVGIALFIVAVWQRAKTEREIDDFVKEQHERAQNGDNNAE